LQGGWQAALYLFLFNLSFATIAQSLVSVIVPIPGKALLFRSRAMTAIK